MSNYTARCNAREKAIHTWLTNNNVGTYLEKLQKLLAGLPKKSLISEFTESIETAIKFCIDQPEIRALDFQWYFDGRKSGTAFAYGLDGFSGDDSFSGSDLGPDELPPLETNIVHEDLVEEDFSDLSVFHSLNIFAEHLNSEINDAITQKLIPEESSQLLIDLCNIFNYKIAITACEKCKVSLKALQPESDFYITMTVHGRWAIPIVKIPGSSSI